MRQPLINRAAIYVKATAGNSREGVERSTQMDEAEQFCKERGLHVTTRTVDPVAAAAEARRSGLWASTEITDTLWPARDARTRPLMPLRRGHMAMLVAAGFLDNLCLEADGRRILVKGRTSKEMVIVEDSPEKEVHREKLKTTVVALDLPGGEITDIAA